MTSTFDFKVGDRVRVVSDSNESNIGKEGNVIHLLPSNKYSIEIELFSMSPWKARRCFLAEELVLVNREPEEDLYI